MNEVVQVSQLASDLLVGETHEVTVAGEGENFSIKMQASGDYEITIDAGWLHHNSSRALTEKVETFTADPNVGNEVRTAVITFMLNDLIESVTVIQQVCSRSPRPRLPSLPSTSCRHWSLYASKLPASLASRPRVPTLTRRSLPGHATITPSSTSNSVRGFICRGNIEVSRSRG